MRSTEPEPPADPSEFPPELQETLRRMSARGQGPVVDLATGTVVAQDGRLAHEAPGEQPVACLECARAIALGWFGSISRHIGPADAPVCILCSEGEATLTPAQWFAQTAVLVQQRTADGQRRTWRDDSLRGLGITAPEA